jgi:hypothetical protein
MNYGAEERQANFRTGSPSHRSVVVGPQTGLSVLMNGGNLHAPLQQPMTTTAAPTAFATMSGIAKEQVRTQDDLRDRDHQASALAAAGMVAESISLTRSDPDRVHPGPMITSHGLEAPPQLAGRAPPPTTSSTSELDNINWNLMDLGSVHLDDMDVDFARLFDPAQEAENMLTEGSGWPSTATSSETSALFHSQGKPS